MCSSDLYAPANNSKTIFLTAATVPVSRAKCCIHFLFSSKIDLFLAQGITVFGDIYDLLDQQFQRLSDLEKTVIYSLAIHRQPLFMPELLNKIIPPVTSQKLLGTLESLKLRSLIECNSDGFTVQNDLREYVTSQLKS